MGIIHEWFCGDHGEFEGTHGICPAFGCDSHDVVKEHRTPVGIKSDSTKRFDAGIRETARSYGQSDFNSAKREGDSSKANSQADQVLWGDEGARMLGKPLTQAAAPAQFQITNPETGKKETWTDRGGVPNVIGSKDSPFNQVTPKAVEKTISKHENEMVKKVQQKY
jgi:hypothetical protein